MPFKPTYHVAADRQAYTMLAGRVGCLMLHGFMGSPLSSRDLATFLSEKGISMHCPLLPGHGHWPDKLYKIPRQAWIDEAEEGLAFLRKHCDEIFVMGHSMGSVLSALLISRYSDLHGIIMLAPLYDVPDRKIQFLRVLRYVMPWFYPLKSRRLHKLVYERVREFDPDINLKDPEVQARLPELTRVPTSGIDEMRKMSDWGRRLWPVINVPAIIFQGGKDVAVSSGNAQSILSLLPHEDKKLHFFPEAGHELMRNFDPAHVEVWSQIYEFIRRRSSLAGSEVEERVETASASAE